MLLIENNLRVVFAQPKSFVIPFLLQLASLTLVSGKHFMLKEFSFYKVARLVDVEQRQAHLDVLEKKKNIKKGLCAKPLVQLPG